jgi:hypothetical protein
MAKARGNPNWCRPEPLTPSTPSVSEFEHQTKKLGLSPDQFETSESLKEWARKNKDQKFVPPDLLRLWGFSS